MSDVKVTDSVLYVGCDDLDIDLFESQYHCAERSFLQLLCDSG